MRIVFASDHAAVALKGALVEHVRSGGHDVIDLGTDGTALVDDPDYGQALARACIDAFLSAEFEGGCHAARVDELSMPSQFRGNPA